MKLMAFMLLAFCIHVSAKTFPQRVTFSGENISLKKVLREVKRQTGYVTFANQGDIDLARPVTINLKNVPLTHFLDVLFANQPLLYSISKKTIMLSEKPEVVPPVSELVMAPPVVGVVKDSTGTPLVGATITLQNKNVSAVTDADGRFSIEASEGEVLVVSYVGYEQLLYKITSVRGTLSLVLTPVNESLEEVVVGYGVQRKVTMTGSVTSVKGEIINKAPVTNISNALVGQLPGLSAVQRSGEPGADGSTIRIRGLNTLGDNNPLVVVDGVPGRSLDRIDASSIENITVLKDASAAIYGAQAANGVILITTKRGKTGKPRVEFTLNEGVNQPSKLPELTNAAEYAELINEVQMYNNNPPEYTQEQIQKYRDGSDPWGYPNTDWFNAVLKPWSRQSYKHLSVSGGYERIKYFVSLGSRFQDGYYRNSATNYKQYDFRSNLDARISEHISVSFDIYGRMENMSYPIRGAGDIFGYTMLFRPNMIAHWPGTQFPGPALGAVGDNPVVTSSDQTGYNRTRRYSLNSNLALNITIPWVKGLTFTGNASLDKVFQFRKVWQTPWKLYSWTGDFDSNGQGILNSVTTGVQEPNLEEWMEDNRNDLLNGRLQYKKDLGDHSMSIMAGMESRIGRGDNFNAFRRFFLSSAIDQMFAGGAQSMRIGGSAFENARLNYFGRVNYNYSSKYLFEFVWRYDGSYIFPSDTRFGFFPGVSLGWRISEENFWQKNLGWAEDVKIRGSWGQTGNDRIPEWQYLSSYSFDGQYLFGNQQLHPRLREARIPNPNITWEVANQTNIGLEASFLSRRLKLEFDYFVNRRSNILWQRNASVPLTTGLTLPRENIGKVSNQGYEFNVSYSDRASKLFYSISLNGGYARNRITFWDETPGVPEYQKSTGRPIPTNPNNQGLDLYYQAIGIFRDQAAVDAYPHREGARPGDVIFEDVNKDGIIDARDRVRNDKTNIPRFTGGLNIALRYGQFDLSVLFQGSTGAVAYTVLESGLIGNYLRSVYDGRWTPDNPDASKPRTFNRDVEYWRTNRNTQFLHKTDFVRIKNLELGYAFPSRFNDRLKIEGLRVYVSGFNLLTLSPYAKDFDPEYYSPDGLQYNASYPVQRVINGGITLTF